MLSLTPALLHNLRVWGRVDTTTRIVSAPLRTHNIITNASRLLQAFTARTHGGKRIDVIYTRTIAGSSKGLRLAHAVIEAASASINGRRLSLPRAPLDCVRQNEQAVVLVIDSGGRAE